MPTQVNMHLHGHLHARAHTTDTVASAALKLELARHHERQPLSELEPVKGMRLLHLRHGEGVLGKIDFGSEKPFHVQFDSGEIHR